MGALPRDVVLGALQGCTRVLLTGPDSPDGDSIGACLAMQRILAARGLRADVAGSPPHRYAWMPGASRMLPDEDLRPGYDAVVVLDGDRHRLSPGAEACFEAARVRAIVDHHASTTPDGYTHCWIEAEATSTCEMVYDALIGWGAPIDRELATCLYVGSIFDTGGFRYSNTTPATHRMAAHLLETGIDHSDIAARVLMERRVPGMRALGRVFAESTFFHEGQLVLGMMPLSLAKELQIVAGDLEGIVDALVFTQGAEVAAILVERPGGELKISLRSRGRVDVSQVAQGLTRAGGGHAKAAGATLAGPMASVRKQIVDAVGAALAREQVRVLA